MPSRDAGSQLPAASSDADTIRLDPRSLRGLAHPLRVRLLGLLREHGPATATQLAQWVDQSSAATSYHLRQLAAYGFIVEDEAHADGGGRERWWRSAHRSTTLETVPTGDPATEVLAEGYLRAVAAAYADRLAQHLDRFAALEPEWRAGSTMSDAMLRLTPEQAAKLIGELEELVARYPRHDPEAPPPPGTRVVSVQYHVLPQDQA